MACIYQNPASEPRPAEALALSESQRLLWLGQRLAPAAPLYNMAWRFDIDGPIEPERFVAAFAQAVQRADALRLVFGESAGAPWQRVLAEPPRPCELYDLSATPDALDGWINARARQPFDLAACVYDSVLIKLGERRWVWFLNQHHLAMDALSVAVLFKALGQAYDDLGAREPLPPFTDFLSLERASGAAADGDAQTHWQTRAQPPATPLRLYGRDVSVGTDRFSRLSMQLGPARTARLYQRALSLTPGALSRDFAVFTLLATALAAFLARVGDRRTLTIGAPAHHRSSLGLRATVGLLIEVLPLALELDEDERFDTLAGKVASEAHAFLRHATPGTVSSELARAFALVLNYIPARFGAFAGMPCQATWLSVDDADPGHALRLHVHDFAGDGDLTLAFDLHHGVFDDDLRQRLPAHFLNLLDALLDDPAQPIDAVALATEDERRTQLERYNRPVSSIAETSVLALVQAQVTRTPDAAAVRCGHARLSYAALDRASDALAAALLEGGATREGAIGIHLERSPELLVAVFAVWKAGGCYVPLETHWPAARKRLIAERAGMSIVLAGPARIDGLDRARVLPVDLSALSNSAARQAKPAAKRAAPDQAAYILFTSGSSGEPKGVVVEHGPLAAYVTWAQRAYTRGGAIDAALHSAFGFDLSVTSLFLPLITGGCTVVYPPGDGAVDLAVLDVFAEDAVDLVKLTPAHLALVLERPKRLQRIRTLILGGEDLPTALARRARDAFGAAIEIYNEYGPTEAVVGCMVHRFDPAKDTGASVPIGVPAEQCTIYVLDAGLNPVALGASGELHIGGARLARGYLGDGARTAERFIADPFRPGGRLYRTGDLARFERPGVLVYGGRADQQLKIQGVRIEPGEIERALLSHAEITGCVVDVVAETWAAPSAHTVGHCHACGLAANVPDSDIDSTGLCRICRELPAYRAFAEAYFGDMAELARLLDDAKERASGAYDCLMLLSGGKDSSYALARLAEMDIRILAATLDNGFISDSAKANIRRVCADLGVPHRFMTTRAMNAIFVDSLERHANVCNGCFKALYTLALRLARDEGIPVIVTGLSRGQFFETRLTPELFRNGPADRARIDATVLAARRAYHRVEDAAARHLNGDLFDDDDVLSRIEFIDFYRYCDASLAEIYAYLDSRVPWIRPLDTGRSTNCLINDAGIYVHKQRTGFHNYAVPYSWDVRLGHKTRDEALRELDDDIDPARVEAMLARIGFGSLAERKRLVAYVTARRPIDGEALRAALATRLPRAMVPSHIVALDALPLTPNGKIDRRRLPRPETSAPAARPARRAPRSAIEHRLAELWRAFLGVERIGIDDNFYQLGGDSLAAIRIAARAHEQGLRFEATDIFKAQTIAALAPLVHAADARASSPPDAGSVDTSAADVDRATLGKVAALLGQAAAKG